MTIDKIKLSQLAREIKKLKPDEAVPNYRAIYQDVVSGDIPAEQINGRWYITRADLPLIADKLCHRAAA